MQPIVKKIMTGTHTSTLRITLHMKLCFNRTHLQTNLSSLSIFLLSVTDLQQGVEPDALRRVDGGVEVVHDEVGVGEREVRRHQREQ